MQFPKKKQMNYCLFKLMKREYNKLVDSIKNTKVQGYRLTHGTFTEEDLALAEKIPKLKKIESAIVDLNVVDYWKAFDIIREIEEKSCHLKETKEFKKIKEHIFRAHSLKIF